MSKLCTNTINNNKCQVIFLCLYLIMWYYGYIFN